MSVSGGGDRLATSYAQAADGAYIAFQVSGSGPLDLLTTFGHNISVEDQAAGREARYFIDRLAAFARVIRFDQRGTGLSDTGSIDQHSWEVWASDAVSVLDAIGSTEAAAFGTDMTSTHTAMMLAATHPDRVRQLALFNPCARWLEAPDYPWGVSEQMGAVFIESGFSSLLDTGTSLIPNMEAATSEAFREWLVASRRRGAGPSRAREILINGLHADMRSVLAAVHVPTLVLIRAGGGPPGTAERCRFVADQLPNATLVELPGGDVPLAYLGDVDRIVEEVEEFLTGNRSVPTTERVLATVLYTDIVDSTTRLTQLGDQAWRQLLDAHDATVRAQLAAHRGREVKNLGDGFLATFDGPAQAINCARAIIDAADRLSISVRAGVHTGEVERRGDDIAGVTVHLGARIAATALAGEILVSRTVTDLVAGSVFRFIDRGEHPLKGIEGPRSLFAVEPR